MKYFSLTLLLLTIHLPLYLMDEQTPLITPSDSGFELVIIEDAITIQKAYDQGLRANREGHLVSVNKNLSSCAGLSTLKDKLNLNTITYVNFSNNKLQEVHEEFFTTMPNLVKCDLSGNHITKMCDPIPPHQHLKTLLLRHNQLTKFPLEQLLQNIPLKQLTLHENKITHYGYLTTDHTSLEQLWIDPTDQKWLKQMIASRCPNLVAEMCEGDTTVRDINTKVEYNKEFVKECKLNTFVCSGACGVIGFLGNVLLVFIPCTFIKSCTLYHALPNGQMIPTTFLGGLGAGLILGAVVGASSALCCTKPEERYTKTILKQIAQYPPIIETLRKQTQTLPQT